MALPKLLMFDEPSLGLSPILVQDVFEIVKRISREGVTVLLVEQNVRQTLAMCDRAYVLENGRVVLEGTGKELSNDPHVKEAYLGI
jgi:branched-chain amino acid transport system ATP-binding protein